MDPNKTEISRLEALGQDLLGKIIARVSATSAEDFRNCILSCKELGETAKDERVLKTLSLAPLVKKPLASIKYLPIMKKYLDNNNQDAHYIRGIIRYFLLDDSETGCFHFAEAANGGQKEAIYMYAMILLCTCRVEEGMYYLSKLKWSEDRSLVDACWKKIKTSMHGIRMARKGIYYKSLHTMRPPVECHRRDMDNICEKCFYYKQMFKFIHMI